MAREWLPARIADEHADVEVEGFGTCYRVGRGDAGRWVVVRGLVDGGDPPPSARWRHLGDLLPTPDEQGKRIIVWAWDDAPGELRALSTAGGDEDWLALVPAALAEEWIPWLADCGPFGCAGVQMVRLRDGRRVHIGRHA